MHIADPGVSFLIVSGRLAAKLRALGFSLIGNMLLAIASSLVLYVASALGDGRDPLAHLDRYGPVIKVVWGAFSVVMGSVLWLVIIGGFALAGISYSVGGLLAVIGRDRWAILSIAGGSSSPASNPGWRADDRAVGRALVDSRGDDYNDGGGDDCDDD